MATVYVIGAGASRHAQYPLATDMGQGVINFMMSLQCPFPQQARKLIDCFGKQPNIEEMISKLGSLAQSAQSTPDPCSPGNLYSFLCIALREWFRQIHVGAAAAYAEFADKLVQVGDVIITFNYDDSLDRDLKRTGKWDVSDGYGFPFAAAVRPSDVLILKLHGSMNWLWPIPFLRKRPLIHRADLEYLGYDFRDSGFQNVVTFENGFFEDWVHRG